ncbi:MAG: M28 family peptidase [Bacteroidetes bacterium]|nr:M28 family peptidase [Bacteroidota bacterium]
MIIVLIFLFLTLANDRIKVVNYVRILIQPIVSIKYSFLFILWCSVSSSQNIEYAKSIIDTLASPGLKGRGYTGNGNFLAAEYIAGEFIRIGLLPFKKNYFQKFNIPVNTFPGEMSVSLNKEKLTAGADYLVESSSPGIKGTFRIVKCTRKEIDTKDKIIKLIQITGENFILIDETNKASENKEEKERIDNMVSILKYSGEIPCKGIIILTKDKLTWDNSAFKNCRPVIIINRESPEKAKTIEIVIENKFIKNFETQNIIGYIKGNEKPDSFIAITAHYDHLGQMGNEVYFPGANDNASGVAMVLNLAGYFSKNPPRYSMIFIAFGAEESGLLGSKYFTENPLIGLSSIKFLLNFDLAGTGEEGIRVVNGTVYRDKFDLLTKINSENNLLPKIDIRGEACNSDHCLFYRKGVPCFYGYTQGGIAAYHDIYDKAETLPLTEFADYCKLVIKFIEAF